MSGEAHRDAFPFHNIARPSISLLGLLQEILAVAIVAIFLIRLIVKVLAQLTAHQEDDKIQKRPRNSQQLVHMGNAIDHRRPFASDKADLGPPPPLKNRSSSGLSVAASTRSKPRSVSPVAGCTNSKSLNMTPCSSSGSRFYANVIQQSGTLSRDRANSVSCPIL